MTTFAFLLDSQGNPRLNKSQQIMIRDFNDEYSQLFNSYPDALDNLLFFSEHDASVTFAEISQSNFHKKEYLEQFAIKNMDGILQFMEHAYKSLGPPNPFPDERLDNMFGEIDYEKDDYALAKLGKIGVHIAGKLTHDHNCIAENYLAPFMQESKLSCSF